MKKPTLIVAGLFVALIAIFFAVQSADNTGPKELGYAIPKMAALDKVEVVQGDKKTTFVKKDGAWRLAEPVDYPMSETAQNDLAKLLEGGVEMDRDMGKVKDLNKYELGADAATVTLYDGGAKKASFKVGKEITVQNTLAKRTYIQPEGAEAVYRAQAGFPSKLLVEANTLREKKLFDFKKEDVSAIEMSADGQKIAFNRADSEASEPAWSTADPKAGKLDGLALDRLASAIGRLRVDGFADGVSDADAGLDKPAVTLTLTRKSADPVTIMIGGEAKKDAGAAAGEPDRYFKVGGQPWVYTLKAYTAKGIDKRLADMRAKEMFSFDSEKAQKITVARPGEGAETTEAVKDGPVWQMKAPREAKADASIVGAALRTLSDLKAERVPDIAAAQAGITPESAIRVEVTRDGAEPVVVFLGAKTSEDKSARYARVGDSGPVFELAGYQADKLLAIEAEKLAPTKPPTPPASAPAGLPPGLQGIPPGALKNLPPGMIPGAPPQ